MKLGLTSVTFRKLDWRKIIQIALDCGLDGIEWGGDIHVPPGDPEHARMVYQATAGAGLEVLSYGSYYRLGEGQDFGPVLTTALALQANAIRVWAGGANTSLVRATEDARRVADMAKPHGVTVAFEYHRGTLTETAERTLALLDAVGRDNVKTYWQPNPERSHRRNLAELTAVLTHLENVHVFHWSRHGIRLPLEDGAREWRAYLQAAKPRAAILEFVKNDDPAQLARDAETLRRL